MQYTQLLPHAAAVEEFVRNYAQLSDSVASTLHALPVQGACDERELAAALQVSGGNKAEVFQTSDRFLCKGSEQAAGSSRFCRERRGCRRRCGARGCLCARGAGRAASLSRLADYSGAEAGPETLGHHRRDSEAVVTAPFVCI